MASLVSTSSQSAIHLLVVVDDQTLQATIERRLSHEGHNVVKASSVREAIDRLRREPFDVVLADLHMTSGNASELLQWLGSYYPSIPSIMICEAISPEFRSEYEKGESVRVIEKPIDLDKLVSVVNDCGPREGFFANNIEIELFDYIQLIALTGRDKAIIVSTRQGMGRIWFEHGDISHVIYGEERGEKAFYKILAANQGVFREAFFRSPPTRTVNRQSMYLLMEAARLKDEGKLDEHADPEPVKPRKRQLTAEEEFTGVPTDSESEPAPEPEPTPEPEPVPEPEPEPVETSPSMQSTLLRVSNFGLPTDDDEEETRAAPATPPPPPKPPRPPSNDVPTVKRKIRTLEKLAPKQAGQSKTRGKVQELTVRADRRPPPRPARAVSTSPLDDPETRKLMLDQFWEFEGVDGVAIISSTGKVIAEDMRNNSTVVTLAGFYMRGAARIARTLGYNVSDGVIARSKNGQQMIMVGMGATSAVLSIAPGSDPEKIRDMIMGVGG